MDKDGSGELDFEEFKALLSHLGVTLRVDEGISVKFNFTNMKLAVQAIRTLTEYILGPNARNQVCNINVVKQSTFCLAIKN